MAKKKSLREVTVDNLTGLAVGSKKSDLFNVNLTDGKDGVVTVTKTNGSAVLYLKGTLRNR